MMKPDISHFLLSLTISQTDSSQAKQVKVKCSVPISDASKHRDVICKNHVPESSSIELVQPAIILKCRSQRHLVDTGTDATFHAMPILTDP